MLIRYYACSLLYSERIFCSTDQTRLDLQNGDLYLATIDNLVTSLHLIHIYLINYSIPVMFFHRLSP